MESWDSTTLFVSAVYRGLFHEMFPYQSQFYELRTRFSDEFISENYLKKGVADKAIFAAYGEPVKESDKVKKKALLYRLFSFNEMNFISLYRSIAHFRAGGSIKANQYCGNSSKATYRGAFGRVRLYQ